MNFMAIAGVLIAGLWIFLVARANRIPRVNTLPARVGINRQQYDSAIAAIESSLSAGEITEALAEQERNRLQHQLVRATEAAQNDTPWETSIGAPARAGYFILPLSIAVLAFFATGGSMHWQLPTTETTTDAAPDIQKMVSQLAERLDANPDDVTGWAMLGRSYMVLQRFDEAAKAWHEANTRSPSPQADFLVAEAEALGLAQNQNLDGRPGELLEQALALDPQNIRGLWFFALAAQARGDEALAFRTLETLAQIPNLPPELSQTLVEIGVILPAASDDANIYRLDVQVTLGADLAARTPPGSTVFIFARTPKGPPMPVAAERVNIGSWPLTVTLDDSTSMMAGRLISEQTNLEIVARISSSGAAKASPGDWEGRTLWPHQPGGGGVAVTIDTVVP